MNKQTELYPNNLNRVRESEFHRLKDCVYLDHAASTLYAKSQIDQYSKDLLGNLYGNPHSNNPSSNLTTDAVHQVRCMVLSHFNVTLEDYEIIFTSGATASLKLLATTFAWIKGNSKFVYLEDNHTSVVGIREVATQHGATSLCLTNSVKSNGIKKNTTFSLSAYNAVPVKGGDYAVDGDNIVTGPLFNLFAFPAQSNFCGCKYPLSWIDEVHRDGLSQCLGSTLASEVSTRDKWSVLLDAASYVSTSSLNLQKHPADFVCLSFYKLFGFPTGLGALLVKRDSTTQLSNNVYFGGGTANGYLASEDYFKPKFSLHERFEDGTISFLDILALKHGFDSLNKITNDSMLKVQQHTFSLVQKLYNDLTSLQYDNNAAVVEVYSNTAYADCETQGPVIAFNVKRPDGSYIGFNHILHLLTSRNIHLRAGCFCNVGACSSMLHLDQNMLKKAYDEGHTCGDSIDIVDGFPVGALRASLAYMSTREDVDALVNFLKECFVMTNDVESDVFHDALSSIPSSPRPEICLKEIYLYPIKSCRAMKVSEWELCETGLKYDRSWMIVNDHGVCLTLKRENRLALIEPFIDLETLTLTLKADGYGAASIPIQHQDTLTAYYSEKICQSKVCGDRIAGYNCGTKVNSWLSEVLGQTVFLIFKKADVHRYSNLKAKLEQDRGFVDGEPPAIALSNEAQYLLVSQSTVEYLKQAMIDLNVSKDSLYVGGKEEDHDDAILDVNAIVARFRCNFLIDGTRPFTEESWTDILIEGTNCHNGSIEKIRFLCTGLCTRCSMICIHQTTGEKTVEPLRTLATLPPSKNLKKHQRRNHFGVYLHSGVRNFTVKVGAVVAVTDADERDF